ncbi:hypothetical protein M1203_36535 [Streptomyces sp. 35G-GA-8]|nr:hypothetical protein [Streptomyces sp. 35G-GA-8]MCL7382298.1 hypothetical protein [Streptomyces sp. 35G-GA-8]
MTSECDECDEVGNGVSGVRPGDAVFGVVDLAKLGGGNAEYAVLASWRPGDLATWALKPNALSWEQAGGAAVNTETATRTLDRLKVDTGKTLLIEGAADGVGTLAIQLAAARGATVIGTAGAHIHEFVAGWARYRPPTAPGWASGSPPWHRAESTSSWTTPDPSRCPIW